MLTVVDQLFLLYLNSFPLMAFSKGKIKLQHHIFVDIITMSNRWLQYGWGTSAALWGPSTAASPLLSLGSLQMFFPLPPSSDRDDGLLASPIQLLCWWLQRWFLGLDQASIGTPPLQVPFCSSWGYAPGSLAWSTCWWLILSHVRRFDGLCTLYTAWVRNWFGFQNVRQVHILVMLPVDSFPTPCSFWSPPLLFSSILPSDSVNLGSWKGSFLGTALPMLPEQLSLPFTSCQASLGFMFLAPLDQLSPCTVPLPLLFHACIPPPRIQRADTNLCVHGEINKQLKKIAFCLFGMLKEI